MEDAVILDKEKTVNIITDIYDSLIESPDLSEKVPRYIEDLKVIIDNVNVKEFTVDLLKDKEIKIIDDIEELKKFLSELIVRFDTSPKNYTKGDYLYLLSLLYKSLIYLYQNSYKNLHPIAYSGDVQDLVQNEYIILDCGSSSEDV